MIIFKKPGHVYLFEEGLELWLRTVQNYSQHSMEMMQLLPIAIELLDHGSDSMRKVLHILEAYILVDPLGVLQSNATILVNVISRLFGGLSIPAMQAFLHFVDVLIQSCHVCNCLENLLQVFYTQGLLHKMINVVLTDGDIGPVIVDIIILVSRMILYNPDQMIKMIESIDSNALQAFLGKSLDKFDAMGHLKQRKLFALALASLVGTANTLVMARIPEIFVVFTSTTIEIGTLARSEYYNLTIDLFYSRLSLVTWTMMNSH
jgi:hypothetical protein